MKSRKRSRRATGTAFIVVSHAAASAGCVGGIPRAAHIYGLPGTPSQQREADEGALMAVCSGWLHQKQVESFQRRAVPEASTMENKPDAEHTGSAWGLPELQAVIADTNSSSVEFNTCAYQTKLNGTSQQDGPANWSRLDRWQGSAHANLGSKTYR